MSEAASGDVLHRVRDLQLPAYGDDEVLFIAETLNRLRPTHIFEWGTNVGVSARIFCEAATILQFDCDVHTVELPPELAHLDRDYPGDRKGIYLLNDSRIVQHLGDGLDVSSHLHAELRPKRALFYLDGCHDYDAVLHELRSLHVAAPKAVLLLHDTVHLKDVASALADFLSANLHDYREEHLASAAGMTALWPRALAL